MSISVYPSSSGGGSDSIGFSLDVGLSGDTTYTFSDPQPAGTYRISSVLGDATFDVYLVDAGGQNVGSSSSKKIVATADFVTVVVYGAQAGDRVDFELKAITAPTGSGNLDSGAAPFILSSSASEMPNVDDTTTITGGNFATNVEVSFVGTDGVDRPAKSVVRSSSTQLIVTRPDTFPELYEPFTVVANNPGITSPSTNAHKLSNAVYNRSEFAADILVIAGGGGGGYSPGGGGGAGGYREFSGTTIPKYQAISLTVGAGGTTVNDGTSSMGGTGTNSLFYNISASGGGGGASNAISKNGLPGGSGGGGTIYGGIGGAGNIGGYDPVEGYAGGSTVSYLQAYPGSGGGGAGGVGGDGTGSAPGNGGPGRASSITGSSVSRAGGGAGGLGNQGGTATASAGGGLENNPGSVNTGGGGGGYGSAAAAGSYNLNGGSGVVILKYPDTYSPTFSEGVTETTTSSGGYKVSVVTATSTGSETVEFGV